MSMVDKYKISYETINNIVGKKLRMITNISNFRKDIEEIRNIMDNEVKEFYKIYYDDFYKENIFKTDLDILYNNGLPPRQYATLTFNIYIVLEDKHVDLEKILQSIFYVSLTK